MAVEYGVLSLRLSGRVERMIEVGTNGLWKVYCHYCESWRKSELDMQRALERRGRHTRFLLVTLAEACYGRGWEIILKCALKK